VEKLKGFLVILLCNFAGSVAVHFSGLPVPGSVLGMLLLLALLLLRAVKLATVEPAAQMLIGLMILFILPSSIGLMNYLDKLAGVVAQLILIAVLVTVLAVISSGWAAQLTARATGRKRGGQHG